MSRLGQNPVITTAEIARLLTVFGFNHQTRAIEDWSEIERDLLLALGPKHPDFGTEQHDWLRNWLAKPNALDGVYSAVRLSVWINRTELTEALLEKCLSLEPLHIATNSLLGQIYATQKVWNSAILCLAKAVEGAPANEVCIANLAVTFFLAGETDDAIAIAQPAWERHPHSDVLSRNLFRIALLTGDMALARRVLNVANQAVPQRPGIAELEIAGDEIKWYPGKPELWPRVASAQLAMQLGDFDDAKAKFEAIAIDYPAAGASGCGAVAISAGRFTEALAYFSSAKALTNQPNPQNHYNLAKAHIALSHYDDAIIELQRALAIDPHFSWARFELSLIELKTGRWRSGWQNYEVRRRVAPEQPFNYFDAAAEWQGEPLTGKTIILVSEQGQGDMIQFIRFATDVAEQGGDVVVFCLPSLVRLVRTVAGVSDTFTPDEQIPAYDYWFPLASVPHRIGLTLDSLPSRKSYVHAAPVDVAIWKNRLADFSRQKIGLIWSGGDYRGLAAGIIYGRRNLSLNEFLPLMRQSGVDFFSLQKDEARQQIIDLPSEYVIHDFSAEWDDFMDTAAFICNLNLVITVDTSVAHLAGALGIPVWILSRTDGCWRWMDRREDSPWYPSARIFHQGIGEEWPDVIDRVKQALQQQQWCSDGLGSGDSDVGAK